MKLAIASISLLLAACTAPQASSDDARAATTEAPAANAGPDINTSVAKRVPGQEDADPLQIFRAFGTEPFWNINVEGATLTLTTPDDQLGKVMQGARRGLPGGVEITGTHGGKPFALTVTAGECSDGMSDNEYDMASNFSIGDVGYTGCAEIAR